MSKNECNSIDELLELGTSGQFPIFHQSWIIELSTIDDELLITKNNQLINNINIRLERHKTYKRKMTILMSLKEEDRNIFIQNFLKQVEEKIVNRSPEIH